MAKDNIKLVPPKPQKPGERFEQGRELGEDPARHRGIEQGLPQSPRQAESPRSPSSERHGDDDDGSMEIGKGEPQHEDVQRGEPYNRENPMPRSAEADNQDDGKGEMSEQREALNPQYRLGYPSDEPRRK